MSPGMILGPHWLPCLALFIVLGLIIWGVTHD